MVALAPSVTLECSFTNRTLVSVPPAAARSAEAAFDPLDPVEALAFPPFFAVARASSFASFNSASSCLICAAPALALAASSCATSSPDRWSLACRAR